MSKSSIIVSTVEPKPITISIEREDAEAEKLYVLGDFSTATLIQALNKAAISTANGNGHAKRRAARPPTAAEVARQPPQTPRKRGRPAKASWPQDDGPQTTEG